MTNNKRILLIGGGGHCKSVLDTLYRLGTYSNIGVIENDTQIKRVLSTEVMGSDSAILSFYEEGYNYAFISIGSIGETSVRRKLFSEMEKIGFIFPNIIDDTAVVSEYARLETGIFIGKQAVVNADSFIGTGAIINTASIVEHDCQIGSFAHLATGTTLCGNVIVGEGTHVGANATVIQGLTIGNNVLIGAGSVVIRSIHDGKRYCGVPAREMRDM